MPPPDRSNSNALVTRTRARLCELECDQPVAAKLPPIQRVQVHSPSRRPIAEDNQVREQYRRPRQASCPPQASRVKIFRIFKSFKPFKTFKRPGSITLIHCDSHLRLGSAIVVGCTPSTLIPLPLAERVDGELVRTPAVAAGRHL